MKDEDRKEVEALIDTEKLEIQCLSARKLLDTAGERDPVMSILTLIAMVSALSSIKAALILEGVDEHTFKAAEKRTQIKKTI